MGKEGQPKTFSEFRDYWNTLPTWRRRFGYFCAAAFFVALFALGPAIYFQEGFLSYLSIVFAGALFACHANYALYYKLSQRRARSIDYIYLGSAALGLFLFAVGYSHQRDIVLAKMAIMTYQFGEEPIRKDLLDTMASLRLFVCSEAVRKRAPTACEGLDQLAVDVKPHLTYDQVVALRERFERDVQRPYGNSFTIEQLRANDRGLFMPLAAVSVRIKDWERWAINTPPSPNKEPNEEQVIISGLGQYIIWPFLLAFALALRITKVTIDVFEWAK